MIPEIILVLTTLFIVWYHRGRVRRAVNHYQDLAKEGLVGVDDVNWMREMLELRPGWEV